MKHILITTIAAVVLVGCGGSKSFTEIISNPWTWVAILPFLYSVLYEVLSFVLGGAIILVGYFLVKFLFRKHGGKTKEELDSDINGEISEGENLEDI